MNELEIYDTTLRDGSQGEGVDFSMIDKIELTRMLDWLGVAFVEGGWPGSNPKDQAYFEQVRQLPLERVRIAAFGSTRHSRSSAEEDPNLRRLVEAEADICCIFGKTWDLHVREALRVSPEDNLAMIADSVRHLREATGRPVFYDAEHFFDGFKANRDYALATLRAAAEAGAERVVLCDTNGGTLPDELRAALRAVRAELPDAVLGIHVHNDGGLAVANTLAAVEEGCVQVQGTINGIGERCGNVDLCAVIANCELKLDQRCLPEGRLQRLTEASRVVWERANLVGPVNQPYVGKAAFAHKGGIHVSAVQRNENCYEHVSPEAIGNERRILVSELSGRSNVLAKLANRYPKLADDTSLASAIVGEIQDREHAGYSYEAAEGSFDLLVRRHLGVWRPAFELFYYRVHGIGTANDSADLVEATVKLVVSGQTRLCVAEGNGPVDALSRVLRLALEPAFPVLRELQLVDYKVRVVNSSDGTGARVRVLIEHRFRHQRFGTIGVSENIIEASWAALVEAHEYCLLSAEDQERGQAADVALERAEQGRG